MVGERRWYDQLSVRLAARLGAVAAALLMVGMVAMTSSASRALRVQEQARVASMCQLIADNVHASMAFDDREMITHIVNEVSPRIPDVAVVEVAALDGSWSVTWQRPGLEDPLRASLVSATRTVSHAGAPIGTVRLGLTTEQIDSLVWQIVGTLLGIGLVSTGLTLFVAAPWSIQRSLRPL